MGEQKLGVFGIVLVFYRIGDLCCDWYCWFHFKNPDQESTMLATCLFGTVFNVWYMYRAISICRQLELPGTGEINISTQLILYMVEGIVNLVQTILAGNITFFNIKRGCVDSMNFAFESCCFFGSLLLLFCFLTSLSGCRGEEKQSDDGDKSNNKVLYLLGLLLSFVSAGLAFFSIADTFGKKLQSC